MLSKFIRLGDRVELQAVERMKDSDEKKIYYSRVHEIVSEDTLEITMPMEQTKLILLPVDGKYELVFYGESGLYQCLAMITDRYKSNNVYILKIELVSDLRKYQRREYYRFSCALELSTRRLDEEEQKAIEEKEPYILKENLPMQKGVIVDISGGGLRFMSIQKYEPGELIYCRYLLSKDGVGKKYEVLGKVLSVRSLPNRPNAYEHRVQYHNMDVETREEIIRFIFEEERKNRKMERNK